MKNLAAQTRPQEVPEDAILRGPVTVETPVDPDASTRHRVVTSILEHGPSTAAELAEKLQLTPAAVRRHLGVLLERGLLASREQRVYGHRGRGRPAKVFYLTDAGRADFYQAYDELAIQALAFLEEHVGERAVSEFATQRWQPLIESYRAARHARPDEDPAEALAEAMSANGFVASVRPSLAGVQVCQHHCPVAHVAERFPELCEAETRVIADLLGIHVQRLATIAHGDGVCTTHVPSAKQGGTTPLEPPALRAPSHAAPSSQRPRRAPQGADSFQHHPQEA